ncbi:MAG: hypothetical protein WCJ93_05000 [Methanomicrobiales archaeon]
MKKITTILIIALCFLFLVLPVIAASEGQRMIKASLTVTRSMITRVTQTGRGTINPPPREPLKSPVMGTVIVLKISHAISHKIPG